jgi:hypothetical protein
LIDDNLLQVVFFDLNPSFPSLNQKFMEDTGIRIAHGPAETTAFALPPDEQCPMCHGDNSCRVAKGELYKGPCWCQEIHVPQHILSRMAAERIEHACLCRPCLVTIARLASELDDADTVIAEASRIASTNKAYYLDAGGNTVFTARYHLERGTCCASGCRHCPY